jgi:hypothetical protein
MGENHFDSDIRTAGTARPSGAMRLSLKGKTSKTR